MFSFFSHFFALCSNRIYGTDAWWASNDARDDATSDADDVVSKSNALNDATTIPVIESTHPYDIHTTTVAIQSTRNYKPNEFPFLTVFAKSF